jgi:hypothetical protein
MNVDPVGYCYNLHLNPVKPNFGIQEGTFFDEEEFNVTLGLVRTSFPLVHHPGT